MSFVVNASLESLHVSAACRQSNEQHGNYAQMKRLCTAQLFVTRQRLIKRSFVLE